MNFKTFFSTSTPHTREHQQAGVRSFNRKHLNQVPFSKSVHKIHPYVTTILKNKTSKNEKISEKLALDILKTYDQNIDKEEGKNFIRKINKTGIVIKKEGQDYYLIYKDK